ncbi:MAG TPA: biopolymer transporter ExbD [Anaeromyxobacteraceae bacterium]|nr:biopolymer transporter ExbD [Anaeromyxobacteraceae bacterium]
MAGGGAPVPESGGRGGKKKRPLDAVINVVPAIDLLACTISFLLFTAVWTQISRLQVQTGGTGGPASADEKRQIQVTVTLGDRGMTLSTSAGVAVEIPALGKSPEGQPVQDLKTLSQKLKQIKNEYPDQSALTVAAEDGILYVDLVRVIDAAVGVGLPAVSVTAAG